MQMPSPGRKNWLTSLSERYHAALLEDEPTLSYLRGRGLEPESDGSHLGLVTDPDPSHEQYRDWLAIPYITPTGVVYMRFRCLEDHDHDELHNGKYLGPKGEQTHLYNVAALHTGSDYIGICEGELDAQVATLAGLPSVGIPGATNWKPHYYRLFDDYEKVFLLGDGDRAGREFVANLGPKLSNSINRTLPEGHDVTSYVTEKGPHAFLDYVGLPPF